MVGQRRQQQKPKRWTPALAWLLFAWALISSQPATAGDWTNESLWSEKLDFLNNVYLTPSGSKNVFSASTYLKTDFVYTSYDSRVDLAADVLAPHYFDYGPISDFKYSTAHLSASLEKNSQSTNLKFLASYARLAERYTSSAQYDNCDPVAGTTLVDCDGEIIDTSKTADGTLKHVLKGNLAVRRLLNERNSVTWNGGIALTDFENGTGPDSVAFNTQAAFIRRLTKRTTGKLQASANWQEIDNAADTSRQNYVLSARIDSDRNERVTLHAETGIGLINTNQIDLADPGLSRDTKDIARLYFLAGADYKFNATTALKLNSQYTAQELGAKGWRHRLDTNLSITKQLNEKATLTVTSSLLLARSSGSGVATNEIVNFNISPSLDYRLTQNWTVDAGYKFTIKDSLVGTATSNELYMSLARKF
jgi:opacity protein-like surface antigen